MLSAKRVRYVVLGFVIAIALYYILTIATIPFKLRAARLHTPHPEAVLVLGGSADREAAAAHLAHQQPDLLVWVSKGEKYLDSVRIFSTAGIHFSRVHLDYQASDTVTNLTTTVAQFQQQQIKHIYLLTSAFHMRRAKAIAFLVLGSRGIAYTPFIIPSDRPAESNFKVVRDGVRSLLWLTTGHTGEQIGAALKPDPEDIH